MNALLVVIIGLLATLLGLGLLVAGSEAGGWVALGGVIAVIAGAENAWRAYRRRGVSDAAEQVGGRESGS